MVLLLWVFYTSVYIFIVQNKHLKSKLAAQMKIYLIKSIQWWIVINIANTTCTRHLNKLIKCMQTNLWSEKLKSNVY